MKLIYKSPWRIICLLILWSFLWDETTGVGVQVLNKDVEILSKSVTSGETMDFLQFFLQSICNNYASNDGLALHDLEESSFYDKNIQYLRRLLKSFDSSKLQEHETTEKRAFFINLYNILMLDFLLNLEEIPTSLESLTDYEELFAYDVGGKILSIAAIKHGILRKNSENPVNKKKYLKDAETKVWSIARDSRIEFSLLPKNSKNLKALTSENLEETLTEQTRRACKNGVNLEGESTLKIDKFFLEYIEDFAVTEEGLLKWLSACVEDQNIMVLLFYASMDKDMIKYSFEDIPDTFPVLELKTKDAEEKLDIEIYASALCDDVHRFFSKQLYPAWFKTFDLINVNIIPFGKASVHPINEGIDFEFKCQNGPEECEGNKMMSCVVAYFPVEIQIILFKCLMEGDKPFQNHKQCEKDLKIPLLAVTECMSTTEGSKLLYENGKKTLALSPKLFFVPTLTFNGHYNSSSLQNSLTHFSDFICEVFLDKTKDTITIKTPQGCKVRVEIFVESRNDDVKIFFLDQLIPTWHRVGESLQVSIIPFGNSTPKQDNSTSIMDKSTYNCPRGPLECYLNVIISCTQKLLPQKSQIAFLYCIFKGKITRRKPKECAQYEGIQWARIHSCSEGDFGKKLMKDNELKTKALTEELKTFPTITVNKVHDDSLNEWVRHDLITAVCDTFLSHDNKVSKKVLLPTGCPVRVDLFIEMLCPDTRNFFTRQFYPKWKQLKPLIDLHFVTFGKANVFPTSQGYEFECQHGAAECEANKIMSCFSNYFPAELQVEFLYCMFTNKPSMEIAHKCCRDLDLDFQLIQKCATSSEGSDLLYENGVATLNLNPTLDYVPTITLNGFYDQNQLYESLTTFSDQICRVYRGPPEGKKVLTPKGCKTDIEIFFSVDTNEFRTFFHLQLLPTWKKFQENMDISLIPVNNGGHAKCSTDSKCHWNKLFLCLSKHYGLEVQVDFLKCYFKDSNENGTTTLQKSKKCCQEVKTSWDKISHCIRTKSENILRKNLRKFQRLDHDGESKPSFSRNGFFDVEESRNALGNFQEFVCDSFQDVEAHFKKKWRPKGCPVNVEIYLESKCDDAKNNFLKQVVPVFNSIKELINLKIIPFGKAIGRSKNEHQYEFQCQHGPSECYGNKMISCIVGKFIETSDQVNMIKCLFQSQFSSISGKKCAVSYGYDWNILEKCIKEEGDELLYENGIKTSKVIPKIFYIPTITMNDFYSKVSLRHYLKDFRGSVCGIYMQDFQQSDISIIPDGCKVTLDVYFNLLDHDMKVFFSNQAEEIWKFYSKIVHLKLIPLIDDWCAKNLELNIDELDFCANAKGLEFLQENHDAFHKHWNQNNKLPLVTLNKKLFRSHRSLQRIICLKYKGPKPNQC